MEIRLENNIKPKEPWMGVLLNYIFAGLGELYAGKKTRGFVFIAIEVLLWVIGWSIIRIGINPDIKITGILFAAVLFFLFFSLIFSIFVLIDGYLCVKEFNISKGIKASNVVIRILSIVGIVIVLYINRLPGYAIKDYLINSFKAYKMSSDSMKPTLQKEDRILIDKKAYINNTPKRGDMVVFIYPKDINKRFIERVVGLPGETLEIKNGKIVINGQELENKTYYYNRGDFGKADQKIEVPQGSYYVLGDNSATARDSRYWGFIQLKDITGKASKIYWPLNRANKIE